MMRRWWHDAVIYQVYPRSFSDSDGDGIGDLDGITARLPYLAETGFDAIWLSPIYRSPMTDFGYDISDHTDVDPVFGDLAAFDRLVAAAHGLGLRVITDLVPNHTSDQHPWFRASRSDRASPYRDWYVWRDGTSDGQPPNNWQSQFPRVGSGWTFDAPSGQWYLHSYLPTQPDLDWDNPSVVAAMTDVMRFWLGRGVDGFRIDVPQRLGKDPAFRDNPGLAQEPDPRYVGRRFDEDQDNVTGRLRALRAATAGFPDALLVGEVYVLDQRRMVRYVNGPDVLDMAHNFVFLRLPWDPTAFRTTIEELQSCLDVDAWPAWCLGNHDHGRIASRFGEDGHGAERARLVALLLLTLRGTPFVYQGDELGLIDSVVPLERTVDIHDRDRTRGPMPWAPPSRSGPGAGFTTGTPWLPITAEAETCNVESQLEDAGSMLSFIRDLLRIRRASAALRRGGMRLITSDPRLLVYARAEGSERVLVVLNFSLEPVHLDATIVAGGDRVIHGTHRSGTVSGVTTVGPLEGLLLRSVT